MGEKILEILLLGYQLAQVIAKKIGAVVRQRDSDKLHEDPGEWFADHFPGELRDDTIDDKDTSCTTPDKHR
ncbi:MAG: hypothetical protein WC117_01070 [Sphaerochaetaceae bacterium]